MENIRNNSGKLPFVIIIALVVVLLLGVGAVAFMKMKGKAHGKAAVKEGKLTPWKLDEFVVNLADPNEIHYLKVNLVLDMAGEVSGGGGGEGGEGGGNPDEPKVRDAIIRELSKKQYAELLSEKGKDELKAELKKAINSQLENAKVANIYFTSFAMQ